MRREKGETSSPSHFTHGAARLPGERTDCISKYAAFISVKREAKTLHASLLRFLLLAHIYCCLTVYRGWHVSERERFFPAAFFPFFT